MLRHQGVSCDRCNTYNFRAKRFKCLKCRDYDLCKNCYDLGPSHTRHPKDHPYQCILIQADYELYYGGEQSPQQRSFTCSICGKMGFTQPGLVSHVVDCHCDVSLEVICPVCLTLPRYDPHAMTNDFANHLAEKHGNTVSNDFHDIETPEERRSTPASTSASAAASNNNLDALSELFSQIVLSKQKQKPRADHLHLPWSHQVDRGHPRLGSGLSVVETTPTETTAVEPTTSKTFVKRASCPSETLLLKQIQNDPEKQECKEQDLAARSLFMRQIVTSCINDPNTASPSVTFDLRRFLKSKSRLELEDVFSDLKKK